MRATLAEKVRRGKCDLDLIEVMACPGGCIGGAGQPVSRDPRHPKRLRTKGLYDADKNMELHKSQENHLRHGDVPEASRRNRRRKKRITSCTRITRTAGASRMRRIVLGDGTGAEKVKVSVCAGTNCFLKGSQDILHDVLHQVHRARTCRTRSQVSASFCFEKCDRGPTVSVDGRKIPNCTAEAARAEIDGKLKKQNGDQP